jgi:hypothetical protein
VKIEEILQNTTVDRLKMEEELKRLTLKLE